ncbi:MAG: phage major capsid protein [Rhizobiales bacterium]|nr:phage major capsid protein [Hyphomicrobiales bacterium]
MNNLDSVLQQMAELTNAVKAAGSKSDLQWADVEKAFGAQIEALAAAQVQKAMESQPVYRQPGAAVGASGQVAGNRYSRFIKSFESSGSHRDGGLVYRPVDLLIAKAIMEGQVRNWSPQMGGAGAAEPSNDLVNAVKAMTSTGAGTGDELVPTGMANQLWDDIFLASRIAANLTRIDMPTNPFDVPLGLGQPTWRKGTENTATTASDLTTAKSVLTATELVTEQNWSYTLDEDSAVAMAPTVRARLAQSGAEVIDAFALNADATDAGTGNINLDDADPDADMYYLSAGQDGIRHQWLVDNTAMGKDAGGDALADADISAALNLMGKYAIDPNQTAIICGAGTYLSGLLGLTNVMTVDKFGPGAVILTGQLAAYRGIPIIVSASASKTEADGKVSTTAGNNTLGQISIINRNLWYAGFRRQLIIEVDKLIQKRQYIMVTSIRMAVAAHGTRSTNTHTSGVRNILIG